ncbi:hypothetical protein CU103_04505 [Phyllobacterium sophorae]|jgi:hypothetical protein|uniref:Uncharacterized protein n=1 Tax=Phyllobacterium sophorae TaxID=1520277 RepID=A0A2P7BHC5_9HYPH|nr:hypothetical protein CU103_04505 [Phyllobacterium sophorae]
MAPKSYIRTMRTSSSISAPRIVLYAVLALGAAAASGLTFAAWFNQGDSIFLSLINAGLAWCM